MKSHKSFPIRDQFKGFKEEIAPVPPNPYKQLDHIFNKGFSKLIEKMYYGQRTIEIPSYGCLPVGSSVIFGEIKEAEDFPDISSAAVTLDICEHEPIDVGFVTPKMVCKKCNKDL